MSIRLLSRALAATTVLLVATACASDTPLATAPDAGSQLAKGGGSTPSSVISVGGTWSAVTPGGSSASVDSTRWSLFLTQNNDRLEGGLTRISYIGSQSFVGTSTIKRGTVSGQFVSLEFDRGEGAETAFTFGATVSDDLRSMDGYHSRYNTSVTLVRR
jgi:hypothetical protein